MPPSFSITNTGVFHASQVEFGCYNIAAGKPGIIEKNWDGPQLLTKRLEGNQSIDAACVGANLPPIEHADVQFLLAFTPAYAWKRSYRCERFTLRKNAYGTVEWFRGLPLPCTELWLQLEQRFRD